MALVIHSKRERLSLIVPTHLKLSLPILECLHLCLPIRCLGIELSTGIAVEISDLRSFALLRARGL